MAPAAQEFPMSGTYGRQTDWLFRAAVLPPLLALLLTACAAPARRQPLRVVDSPMSLPKRMAALGMWGRTGIEAVKGTRASNFNASFRYGLTNRLELVDVLSLRYTFADDAPTVDGTAPSKISVAVRAGLTGFGASSIEGAVFWPVLQLHLRKRVSPNTYLFSVTSGHSRHATAIARHSYLFFQSVGSITQISARWAWHSSIGASNEVICGSECTRQAPWAKLGTGWSMRPAHWIEFGPSFLLEYRLRGPEPIVRPTPDQRVSQRATRPIWISGLLDLTFFW